MLPHQNIRQEEPPRTAVTGGIELSARDSQVLKEINQLQHSGDPRKSQKLKQLLKDNPTVQLFLKAKIGGNK